MFCLIWYNLPRIKSFAHSREVLLIPFRKGVIKMTAYETISLMIAFGMLIAVLSKNKEK
ncbi:putative holin-like toxin [Bacillus haynesii]|nr:putative holin-like toxin [Bacillus haynesii]